ncbi:MAG: type II toxin-antitoxin system VapC family toxin [Halobacteriota archaeon]
MVCFDTDFLVALLRKEEVAIEKLETYVEREGVLSTTVISACELFEGAYKGDGAEKKITRVKELLRRLEILELNLSSSELFGKVYNELRLQGRDIGVLDTLISSIVLANGDKLITRNIKHFERVTGLLVESW